MAQFEYQYSFINNGKTEAGITAGLAVFKYELALAGGVVINDDPTLIPYGSYLFYNHSEMEINGKLGISEIKLKPHSAFHVTPSAKLGASLGFELWHMTKNKKAYLQRNTFQYKTNKYLIVFLYSEKTANGKLSLKSKGLVKFKGGSGN